MKHLASGLLRADLAPDHWLGTTPALDLSDDRLRLRAKALTQLGKTDHARALAIYGYVKSLAYSAPRRVRFPTARQVMDARRGDCFGKSTLFVALLRLADIPSRIRIVQLRGELIRGYAPGPERLNHAIVEVWLGGRWVRTDTHVYDVRYLVAARSKLASAGWDLGYSVHRHAQSIWNGRDDAFAAFTLDDDRGMPLADLGVYNDPTEFVTLMSRQRDPLRRFKALRWSVLGRMMAHGIERLRQEDPPSPAAA